MKWSWYGEQKMQIYITLGMFHEGIVWKQLETFGIKKILDFGSGIGVTANYLAEHNDLDGIAVYNHGVISSPWTRELQKQGYSIWLIKLHQKDLKDYAL